MKLVIWGLAAGLAVTGLQAEEDSGHYFKFDVGANYTGDLHQDFKNIPGDRDLKMNLGLRTSVAEGLALNRFFALEVESAFLWNELDHSTDWVIQVPVFANAVLRYQSKRLGAYVAAGGGGACVIAKTMLFEHDTDLTVVPAWQGTAGLNYNFGGGLSVGLVYKYMGIQDPKFELTIQGTTEVFKFHNLHNHYGGLQLVYSF